MTALEHKAYATGVLKPEVHHLLVKNLPRLASTANIPESMVLHKMSDFQCSLDEIKYVKKIRVHAEKGIYGAAYLGASNSFPTRMMAVAGACLRNFIDAKVMTLQEVLEEQQNGSMPEPKVLLIPNFFVAKSDGGKIADWHIAHLLGLLLSRMTKQLQTVVAVSDLNLMSKTYGEPIAQHIAGKFVPIK